MSLEYKYNVENRAKAKCCIWKKMTRDTSVDVRNDTNMLCIMNKMPCHDHNKNLPEAVLTEQQPHQYARS